MAEASSACLQARDAAIDRRDRSRHRRSRSASVKSTRAKLDDADNAIVAYKRRALALRSRGGRAPRRPRSTLRGGGEVGRPARDPRDADRADATDSTERLATLRFRSAELMRTRTGDLERAIETYGDGAFDYAAGPRRHRRRPRGGHHRSASADFRVEAARTLDSRTTRSPSGYARRFDQRARGGRRDRRPPRQASARSVVRPRSPRSARRTQNAGLRPDGQGGACRSVTRTDLANMLHDLERHAAAVGQARGRLRCSLLEDVAPDIMDGELQTEALMKAAIGRSPPASSKISRPGPTASSRAFSKTSPTTGPRSMRSRSCMATAEDYEALLDDACVARPRLTDSVR